MRHAAAIINRSFDRAPMRKEGTGEKSTTCQFCNEKRSKTFLKAAILVVVVLYFIQKLRRFSLPCNSKLKRKSYLRNFVNVYNRYL